MFEVIKKKYTFDEFPERELNVWGRKDTLDFKLLDGVKEYDFSSLLYTDGDVVIDIGAYTGQEVLWFMAQGINLEYYAFEPLLENFLILDRNIKENNKCLDLDWAQYAVGEYLGTTKMYYGGEGDGKWRNLYRYMGNIKPPFRSKDYRKVPQVRIDDIFQTQHIKKCRLVKIDAEGAELKILKATPKKTLDKIYCIVGEYHEGITPKQLLRATHGIFKNTIESDHLFRFIHK